MLNDIFELLDLCGSQKVRLEVEKSEDGKFSVLIQNMSPVDSKKDSDEAVNVLKSALSMPLLLKGTIEQLEAGIPDAIQSYFNTAQHLSCQLQSNLDAIKAQAVKAKAKSAAAASKRNKKSTGKTVTPSASASAAPTNKHNESTQKEKVVSEPEPKHEPLAASDLF